MEMKCFIIIANSKHESKLFTAENLMLKQEKRTWCRNLNQKNRRITEINKGNLKCCRIEIS